VATPHRPLRRQLFGYFVGVSRNCWRLGAKADRSSEDVR
jgi:hypothetical protein